VKLPTIAVCALALASACGSSPPGALTPAPGAAVPPPATALDALEQRLTAAHTFRFHVRLATSGRIESHYEGDVVAGPDRRARLALQGSFGNRDADVLFTCDGKRMRAGRSMDPLDVAPDLRDGITVAFVRMGLTHDVARLAAGKFPDYLDGSVRQHLEVIGAAHAPGEELRGGATERWTWALYVDHQRAADETLWLDARSGLPVRRRVTVHFPEGDMDVGEEYEGFAVDVPVPEETFRVEP
jgi:hypothetical protein